MDRMALPEHFITPSQIMSTQTIAHGQTGASFILDSPIDKELPLTTPHIDDNPLDNLGDKLPLDDVCPWLNVEDDPSCMNEVNLDNIELYLECSDDGESSKFSNLTKSQNGVWTDQEGTSMIKSDVQLKISFPNYPDEKEDGFKCCVCKTKFVVDMGLRDHIHTEHTGSVLLCPLCMYNTKSKKFFNTHLHTVHKQSVITNTDTAQLLDTPEGVGQAEHGSHTDERLHSEIFTEESNSQPDTKLKRSNQGPTGNDKRTDIDRHVKVKCEFCPFVTHSQKLLKSHQMNMHTKDRETYSCSMCGFVCFQTRTLESHVRYHTGLFQFRCEVCDKEFTSISHKTRHMKTHSETRNYACDYEGCKVSFKTKGAVTDHKKKVHGVLNSQQHVNKICGEDGATIVTCGASGLNAERQLHEKSTQTSETWKRCQQRGVKKTTLSVASSCLQYPSSRVKVKKYSCQHEGCTKTFRDNFNLNNHMAIHDGRKCLECNLCDFKCVQKSSLNFHFKTKHLTLEPKT